MPPKSTKSTKKRKLSSSATQATLHAYTIRSQPSLSSPQSTPTSAHSPSTPPQTENVSPMMIDSEEKSSMVNIASVLGSFRRNTNIRSIRVHNSRDEEWNAVYDSFFKTSWGSLQTLVIAILHNEPEHTSFQIASEMCADNCRLGHAEQLYQHLIDQLSQHMQSLATPLQSAASKRDRFLETLNDIWLNMCAQLNCIRNVFMELDRRYVIWSTNYRSLVQAGKDLFNQHVLSQEYLRSYTIEQLLYLIKRDRDGETVDRILIHSLVSMLNDLALYNKEFQPRLLRDTAMYYGEESDRLIHSLSIPEYLAHVDRRRTQESIDRIRDYLKPDTKAKLLEAVTDQLIFAKIDLIISKGFYQMMDDDAKDPLRILYTILASSATITTLRTAFAEYIKRRGTEMVSDPSRDAAMVPSLLKYKAKLDDIVNKSFNNDVSFINTMKESFETFINMRRNKPAEMVAKFIDSKLRKKASDENLERILDRVLVIFRYLQGKDTFEAFYKRFLAKRLLLNRMVSNDIEKSMLSRLKTECGPDFTKNLEAMFKDIEISADLNAAFKESQEYSQWGNVQLYVNVLAQGIWPSYSASEIILPPDMRAQQEAYIQFYGKKYTGRRLTWQNSLGSCSVKAHFSAGFKELMLSLFQTVILLLFNDTSRPFLTYNDIFDATNLDHKELRRVLQSLSCGQHQILKKEPSGTTVEPSDQFAFNEQFQAPQHRLKFNTIQQEQTVEEQKDTQSKVLVNRQHQLEAAIVRIMKANKRLSHAALVNELFEQLKFPVDAADIKKRIESLIDRDYLVRDEKDNSMYNYQS
ncbi:cullin [Radiomyces spectabilis]|uniref:cullin n=1 Tax=Radiomyces spectabilis TaxID=64574 RepID=UPI00221F1920|nr:cullin [Radiomyces spectabilis]KAI8365993.1 cullin [Radiomyces spectabilis]